MWEIFTGNWVQRLVEHGVRCRFGVWAALLWSLSCPEYSSSDNSGFFCSVSPSRRFSILRAVACNRPRLQ